MSNINIQHVNSIGHAGDINNYGLSRDEINLIRALSENLKELRAHGRLSTPQQRDLNQLIDAIDIAGSSPTPERIKTTVGQIAPALRTLLSSIGANLASDVVASACTHAYQHFEALQRIFH